MQSIQLGPDVKLQLAHLKVVLEGPVKVILSDEGKAKIQKGRTFLEEYIEKSDRPVYGINTGFGYLCNVEIEKNQLAELQQNLVESHACGMGEEISPELVRLMLLLKIQSFSYGHSGVRMETVEQLIAFVNADILPIVYEFGSLGASGDLAPLAHLSLGLMGKGEVLYKGKRMSATEALEKNGLKALKLASKEGLALLNGTQFMSAHLVLALIQAHRMAFQADVLATLSLEAFDGRSEPFYAGIQEVRPHEGQIKTARNIREILRDSELQKRPKVHVQDPYSLRCVPQVHGASRDTITYVTKVVETEINSVSDNPTLFPDDDRIISAGNFHGQSLALVADFLAIALAELGSISERRTYVLNSGQRGLPAFLTAKPGLHSGLMITQYTAASIVSQNKQLCTPASVDSLMSSNGQEDHVSMGANACTKLLKVVWNLERILGIELLNGSQALFFQKEKSSPFIMDLLEKFREGVPFIDGDRIMHNDMLAAQEFLHEMEIDESVLWENQA